MDKKFNTIINELVGLELNDIFYQPTKDIISETNMFVIKFGSSITYTLNVFSFVRISKSNKILLTSSDEFFDANQISLSSDELLNRVDFKNSLLEKNIDIVKEMLISAKVQSVKVNDIKDIEIIFDNKIKIEISIDCILEDYEYYRFFTSIKGSKSYIVIHKNGVVTIK